MAARVGVDAPPVDLPAAAVTRVAVFVPIWKRPWMSIGTDTYGSSMLTWCGASNVFAGDDRYPELELDEAARRRPALVLAPSEPYPFTERHRTTLETVAPVRFVDGRDLFWWGSRTPGAIERLQALLASVAA
jgi:hypothetical protein